MKLSTSIGALAAAMTLTCLLGLAPRQAGATVVLTGCGADNACSLDELVSGGSIDINGTQFSNFSLDSIVGVLDAAAIRVDTIDALSPGFTLVDIGGTLNLSNGASLFSNLLFDVTGSLALNGISLAAAAGSLTGDNSYAHVFVDPGFLDTYCDVATGCSVNGSASLPPSSVLHVLMGIDVTADAVGAAQFNSITLQVAAVPEPGTVVLLALGLAGLGVVAARRKQANS